MYRNWPSLGPIQGDACLRHARPTAHTFWIHGRQAHLRHGGEPVHPHSDVPHRPYRHP